MVSDAGATRLPIGTRTSRITLNSSPSQGSTTRSSTSRRFPASWRSETRKIVFGHERRLVVCHSEGLQAKQSRGFDQTLAKACRQLADVQARLACGKTRKSKEKVEAEIAQILALRGCSRVISITLTGDEPAELRLSFTVEANARAALEAELFGKRILFTDHAEWSTA
jgi:hypothetical protein